MEPSKGEESGGIYLPDDQGEYAPESGVHNFSIQVLSDALTALEHVQVDGPGLAYLFFFAK